MKTLKKRGVILAFFLLVLYLGLNIGASQIVAPLYFRMVNNENRSFIEFLTAIRPLPAFEEKLKLYKNLYGAEVEPEVFAQENRRSALINKLEQILKNSPSQRDILYSLYLLYSDKGDINQADVYFKKAQEIDPTIR